MRADAKFLMLPLLVAGFAFSTFAGSGEKVDIEVREHRAEIRAELLKYTPIGSSTQDVLSFIKTRLERKSGAEPKVENHPAGGPSTAGSQKIGVKCIKIFLGDYVANPGLLSLSIPLAIVMDVYVQWAFDEKGRLVEIFVERKAEGP